jgi:REP element-mobilizing transposase RayT
MFLDPQKKIEKHGLDLPHWQQGRNCQFVTFRLGDLLPKAKLDALSEEIHQWRLAQPKPWTPEQQDAYHQRFTYRIERWLDAGHGSCLLELPENRAHLEKALMRFQGARVVHHAWVIMPNHVHLLFEPRSPLGELIKAWKGVSARKIDKGSIWQKNYRDTLIRNREHDVNALRYIRRNPAKLRPGSFTLWENPDLKGL